MSIYAGVMSGTSLDGADAVIADLSQKTPTALGFASATFPDALRATLLDLNRAGGTDELARAYEAGLQLSDVYAQSVAAALADAQVSRDRLLAIGCHGQTVRHRPERGYTVQINHPARLALITGVPVVADFRSMDIAAGGQGAPLAPAFHRAVFAHPAHARAVINIGGIANVSALSPNGGHVIGFDTGPGNVLMDAWCERSTGEPYDRDGRFAAQGQVIPRLLAVLRDEPFLALPPPKSTGRDLFGLTWLESHLRGDESAADVQATLLALTVDSIAEAILRWCPEVMDAYVCGGGAHHPGLMQQLCARLAPRRVQSTAVLGMPPKQVEALAFAWLARHCVERKALDLSAITGACRPLIYGALYAV